MSEWKQGQGYTVSRSYATGADATITIAAVTGKKIAVLAITGSNDKAAGLLTVTFGGSAVCTVAVGAAAFQYRFDPPLVAGEAEAVVVAVDGTTASYLCLQYAVVV